MSLKDSNPLYIKVFSAILTIYQRLYIHQNFQVVLAENSILLHMAFTHNIALMQFKISLFLTSAGDSKRLNPS